MTPILQDRLPGTASAKDELVEAGGADLVAFTRSTEPPFVIEHLQNDRTPSGQFTPDAQMVIMRALRTSGLLSHLPDSEARSLLAVLTLLTANGRLSATASQVAAALGVSEAKAQSRLDRLCQLTWNGKPIAAEQVADSGLKTVSLSSHVVASRQQPARKSIDQQAPLPAVAGRAAVIAHSRAHYGRPRAEVEREVAEQFGWGGDRNPTSPAGRLTALGVPPEEARTLAASFTEEEIANQIDWLPYRGAKNPARFVVAAIEGKYEPPARIRLERAIAAEEAETEGPARVQVPSELPVGETADLTLPEEGVVEPEDGLAEPWDE